MNESVRKNKKLTGKFKIETAKNILNDEFICLRSKMYESKSGKDSREDLKVFCKSQWKSFIFEEKIVEMDVIIKKECDN